MTLGIIACLYGQPELLSDCLSPWFELKDELSIKIAAVHGQFKEYYDLAIPDNDFETQKKLKQYNNSRLIEFLYMQRDYDSKHFDHDIFQSEAKIRDEGLQWLLEQNVDYIGLLDLDEKYTKGEIRALVNYIQKDPFISVYHIEFKNLVFDNKYYVKGFNPRRIWKVDCGDYRLNRINFDNDCIYKNKNTGEEKQDTKFSTKNIPTKLVNPLHFTWNDVVRAKKKIDYQLKHFSTGCSYKVENDKIVFNMDFFKRTGQTPPQVYEIEDKSKD